jgi:hypothetical protein
MHRAAWLVAGSALLILGSIAGAVVANVGDEPQRHAAAVEPCTRLDTDDLDAMNAALFPWRGFSFRSASWVSDPRGPLAGLTIIRAEVDGPGFEDVGDVSIWATGIGYVGTFPGFFLYALNPVARRVEGRATFPASRLRQVVDDGEPVYDPRIIRAIAPTVMAWCIEANPSSPNGI